MSALSQDLTEVMGDDDQNPPPHAAVWDGQWPQTRAEFERLVEVFQDRLVRYAFRRLGNLHDAEDVAQEIFVRAYADRERHRSVARVSPYLYRMAANLCTDVVRKRRQTPLSLDDPEILEIPANQPTGSDAAAAAEEQRRIEGVLRRIPQRQAEVVRLRVFDELRLREVAEVVGCSVATAKSRLRYGLEKLREIVLREWEVLR